MRTKRYHRVGADHTPTGKSDVLRYSVFRQGLGKEGGGGSGKDEGGRERGDEGEGRGGGRRQMRMERTDEEGGVDDEGGNL